MTIYIQALIPQKQKGSSSKVKNCAISFVCAVVNWNKTEKLNMSYFLFWICFDDWKSLRKKIPKYLNLKTTFQERIWDCQQESLLVPGKTTISKNNQNYPPKWFFSLQINAKFGWRKLFGLMWKCLWIGARFAPNWKKRHQLVQKDVAQPQLSHHNYKLSLFPFCCRYFQTSPAKCR